MTEAEWDSTQRADLMHPVLRASRKRADVQARRRKYRLMACALCRDMWDVLEDERSREAVEVAEQFADGLAGGGELDSAKAMAWEVHCRGDGPRLEAAARTGRRAEEFGLADHAGAWVAHHDAAKAAENAVLNARYIRRPPADDSGPWRECDLIRELFGNPLRPTVFDLAWRTVDVTALARAAYDERLLPSGRLEVARLSVLADAVEEAGCSDQQLLGHLRGPGPHVRGCWALDAVLGKR
jgi:hypothetical protein